MRVTMLTNFIAPYRVPLLEAVRDRVGDLRIFVSTPMEEDRDWAVEWGSLDVVVQRNLTLRGSYRDSFGFSDRLKIHVPYDTLAQLYRFRPDVVISGELGARSLQAAAYAAVHPRVPLLIWATLSEHSERDWGRARQALRRVILARADGVLTNGESGARYIRRFGIPDDRIFRINQPVAVDLFAAGERVRPEAEVTRLLYVGYLSGRKGIAEFGQHLLDHARAYPSRAFEVWWVGEGDKRRGLEALPFGANVSQRFFGSLPYAALPDIYRQCDALIFPTLRDEWGLVVNEAMAAGLPVLGSIYSQAVEELVREGETGWVFDPRDAASAHAALDRMFGAGPDQLASMRRACRERIGKLTPLTACDRIGHAIDEVLRGRQNGAPTRVQSVPG
ncbi:glycosyltransferase family 4 protein [Roseomonas elaeocarpi]|uniref:Glycosyltransferase family 4 protein n=1 Tax=Roseomonas elaeocarpi TaxID=907779 RepID=A0ABV6JMC6_9PROT